MNTNYGMEIVRATEIAALTAARLLGLGNQDDILNSTRKAIAKTLDQPGNCALLVARRIEFRDQRQPVPIIGDSFLGQIDGLTYHARSFWGGNQ